MRALLLLLLTATLAGCFGGSSIDADAAAQAAMDDFVADFFSDDGGDLSHIMGQISYADGGAVFTGDFDVRWGSEGGMRIDVDMTSQSGGATFEVAGYVVCKDSRVYIGSQAGVAEHRSNTGDSCFDALQDVQGPGLFLSGLQDAELLSASAKGSVVTATFQADNDTFTIIADGQLQRIEMETSDLSASADVEHGAREPVAAPAAAVRAPSANIGAGIFANGMYRWSASEEVAAVPLSDIQIQIHDDAGIVAAFIAGQDGEQAGFVFDFSDDGDGKFGSGDSFTIQSDAWTQRGEYRVILHDQWADRRVGDMPAPVPLVLALAALAGAAMLRRTHK